MSSFYLLALLQTWHELNFNLGNPDDVEAIPWSIPVSIVITLGIVLFLYKGRRNYMALPEIAVSNDASPQDVTVVIPARNEERRIAKCVKSFAGTRVIVVDDASTDRTAELARNAGAEVIEAPPLLPGVKGKPNALWAGAQLAQTTYVLFVDADTTFSPQFLASAIKRASSRQVVLASAFLKQKYGSLAERMLMPYAFALYFCGVNAKHVQDFLKPETLANGQCMLFLREPYEFFGGHKSVQTSVIEDVAIAQKVKRHRMPLEIVRAENLGSVRMYESFGEIWRGFQKNSFRFLRENQKTGAQVMIASILLTSMLPLTAWLIWEQQWPFAIPMWIIPPLMLRSWYGGIGRALLCYPAIYIFQAIALHGMFTSLFGLKAEWKGRKV
ncbi:MAG: glycosyltransferase [Bryobacterales bacterium]|nr:glycosyltransferase [Bryobacterales bacterium]